MNKKAKAKRNDMGKTQDGIAEKIDVEVKHYGKLETGQRIQVHISYLKSLQN